MSVDVLLGLQWGDEGKGKVVDVLTPQYDIIARFQGGPNAGHTLIFDGKKHVLHTIPSGIFHDRPINLIGNGVVIDPVTLNREIDELKAVGVDVSKKLYVSKKAHLIIPSHRLLDAASEQAKGKTKIGSTLKGIGPTYMDKTGRNGLRVGDILLDTFKDSYDKLVEKHKALLATYPDFEYDIAEWEKGFFEGVEIMKTLNIVDGEQFINDHLKKGAKVLAEGAQGSMLDVDFGTYPFVTSSNTTTAGVCTGLGIAPQHIKKVIGIAKAYCTRVGNGPFPTELDNEVGQRLRDIGGEYGATTGRPRRCGWIDLVALKYAIMISGVTDLVITKVDCLDAFEEIEACTHYMVDGEKMDYLPFDIVKQEVTPIYEKIKGWNQTVTTDIPADLDNYLTYLERELGVAIPTISVGPDRKQIIDRKPALV